MAGDRCPSPPIADATGPTLSRDAVPRDPVENPKIADEIIRQIAARGAGGSICPSEVARALDPDWRKLLAPVRRAAAQLAEAGRIDILRKGKPVAPLAMRGVIRLRFKAGG
jgi:hypothetical protein